MKRLILLISLAFSLPALAMQELGNIAEDASLTFYWNTFDDNGASVTRATNGTVKVRRSDGTDCTAGAVTDNEDTPGTGIHECVVDTSVAANFATGYDYVIWVDGMVVAGDTINCVLARFSIQKRYGDAATVRTLLALPAIAPDAAGGLPTTTKITDARLGALTDWLDGGRLDLILDARAPASTALSNATWADARAAKLDYLTGNVALAATALSNATWTDAKAGYLTGNVALAATALSNATWTDAKAGYLTGNVALAATALSNATWTDARAAKLDYLTGATTITTQTIVATDGTATIFRGDDYLDADGRALTFTVANYSGPSLSGGTATLALVTKANYDRGLTTSALSVTLTVTGTTTLTCKADLTDTQTAALASNPSQAYTYIYQLRATTKGGSKVTLGQGTLVVRPRIAE